MNSLLIFWMAMFGTLAISLAVLNPVYSILGADLGLRGFWRETMIAVIVSFLQAGVLWAALEVTGLIIGQGLFGSAAVLYVCYKATHSADSVFEGTCAMDGWAIGAVAFTQYGLIVTASCVLPAFLGR
ncbi:MAG: hypothetical protein WC740_22560 [Verrucomicrobiia bacterium]